MKKALIIAAAGCGLFASVALAQTAQDLPPKSRSPTCSRSNRASSRESSGDLGGESLGRGVRCSINPACEWYH